MLNLTEKYNHKNTNLVWIDKIKISMCMVFWQDDSLRLNGSPWRNDLIRKIHSGLAKKNYEIKGDNSILGDNSEEFTAWKFPNNPHAHTRINSARMDLYADINLEHIYDIYL